MRYQGVHARFRTIQRSEARVTKRGLRNGSGSGRFSIAPTWDPGGRALGARVVIGIEERRELCHRFAHGQWLRDLEYAEQAEAPSRADRVDAVLARAEDVMAAIAHHQH